MKTIEEWKLFTTKKLTRAKAEVAKLQIHLEHPEIHYEKYVKGGEKTRRHREKITPNTPEKKEEIQYI